MNDSAVKKTDARKTILVWSLTLVLLAAAWGVSKATLPDDASAAPFPIAAEIDEPVTARNLAVTVTDVHIANRVRDAKDWTADGTWVVVDLEAAGVLTQDEGTLQLAQLVIGDRTFGATDRGTTFLNQRLVTGVPRSGSVAFELPEGAAAGAATLRLGTADEVLLDDVIELPLQLDEVAVETEVLLEENGWAR